MTIKLLVCMPILIALTLFQSAMAAKTINPLAVHKIILGQDYCGDRKLPGQLETPLDQLANIRPNLAGWEEYLIVLKKQRQALLVRQKEIDSNPNTGGDLSGAILNVEKNIAEQLCLIRWAKIKVVELEPIRKAFLHELKKVENEYEAIKNECGDKPNIEGWTKDETAKEWAKCRRSRIGRHNRKLRELKRLRSLLPLLK